ncbi:MAG: ABC transporter ATP-binding protein [Solobacterium sp.]|nr:ABC transporter ATP-binding protein [Solobacterium sp.]
MRKALGYLKPFWLSVIAIIALVFAQVQMELALPDYMSDIVTYGIQYGGITEDAPKVMRSSTASLLQYFMDEDIRTEILDHAYTKIEQNDPAYADTYPVLKEQAVYLRNDAYDGDVNVAEALQKPFLIVSTLQREEIMKQMGVSSIDELMVMLENVPGAAQGISAMVDEQMNGFTADNLGAAERMMIRSEYASVGLDTDAIQNGYILHEGLIMLGIALLGSLCAIASAFLASRTATGACRNMRGDVFRRVESFSNEEFSRFSTASLITRTTNDIQQVQMLLTMLLRIVLFAPFMGFTSLFKVLRYKQLASVLGWTILIMISLMILVFFFTYPKFKIAQKLVDRLNLVTREQLDGMLVIRAFNNEDVEEKRFDEVNTDITKLNIFLNRTMSVISPVMSFLMSSVSVLIIWIGANQIDIGAMQIGDMMAFLQYAIHVLMSFMIVAMIFIMIPRSSVSANRVFEVLETVPAIHDPKEPKHLAEGSQVITFDHVHFRYPKAEQDVLEDISFTASPGETVAFIGSTGSGKSTLVNLLPRFFDVTQGSIRYGDIDIRDVTQHELRDRIGYVPQKGILFSGTIRSNLLYADEHATQEALDNALDVSQAREFVEGRPEKIDDPIAQGGTNVSGGQKQRLSIARALTKKADVFIFDDTFSALDYKTDAKLREALNAMIKKTGATVLIVAQRISTIMHADKIVVLDSGKVAGIGTHEELLKNCQVYQEIAYSQLNEEELAK